MKNIEKIHSENLISQPANNPEDLKRSRKAGFTLVELIVVVAILSILVAFSAGTLVSVTRRKATRVVKVIDSELTLLASNAYSREGCWRLMFEYDSKEEGFFMIQQFNTSENLDTDAWVDFSKTALSSSVDLSFGDDVFEKEDEEKSYCVSLSREKGCYLTEGAFDGYFCGNIYVRSADKIVCLNMSKESGGHRVVD